MPSRQKADAWRLWPCWWTARRGGAIRLRLRDIGLSRYSIKPSCSAAIPDHINERIARLCELVQAGLFEENLDSIVRECGSLAQDSVHVLVFFTLKNVFMELCHALDCGAIEVTRHQELVAGIAEKAIPILQKLAAGNRVAPEEIEDLVRTHVVNRNLFSS